MNRINFYFDEFLTEDVPVPNGELKNSFDLSNANNAHSTVVMANTKSNFNEFLNNKYHRGTDKKYLFEYEDIEVTYSNNIVNDAKNFYLVMPKMHFQDLDDYLPFYQTKLEQGFTLFFASFHEIGGYTNFFKWVNENPFVDNIVILSIAKNLNEIVKCKTIFFPFLLFDFGNDFLINELENSVCTLDDYVNTPKEKYFVSWNRNARRFHRLIYYEFLKENNLLNNFISFIEFPEKDLYLNFLTNPNYSTVSKYLKNFIENGAERIDLDLHGIELHNVQPNLTNRNNKKEFYAKSYFTIVAETNYYEEFEVLTEKIIRPIANFHPFILIGPKNGYKVLTDLGFKIPKIINYEYIDETQNPNLRLIRTFEEIKKLIEYLEKNKKLPNLNIEDLSHNQNLLININKKKHWYNLYKQIFNII